MIVIFNIYFLKRDQGNIALLFSYTTMFTFKSAVCFTSLKKIFFLKMDLTCPHWRHLTQMNNLKVPKRPLALNFSLLEHLPAHIFTLF